MFDKQIGMQLKINKLANIGGGSLVDFADTKLSEKKENGNVG